MSTVILGDTPVEPAAVVLSSIQDYALNAVVQCKCVNPIIPLRSPLTAQLLLSNDAGASYVLADTKRFGVGANDASFQTFILSNYATQIINTQVTFVGSTAAARTLPGSNLPAQPTWTNYMIRFTGNLGGTVTASGIADVGGGGGGGGGGTGTVTSFAVVPANGFDATVINASTTPTMALKTTVSGILKGNATTISAAVAGTDYLVTLPNPSTSTLGGIRSVAAVGGRWINSISTAGVPSLAQPAFVDLTGAATPAQLPTSGLTINQHVGTILTVTEIGGVVTLNLAASDNFTCTIDSNATLTISNPPVGVNQKFRLELVQAASGGPYTVNWFPGITWFGSGVPAMTTTAGNKMTFAFEQTGSGTYSGYFLGEGGVSAGVSAGGSSGQVQYNNGGVFGGFTMSGDATLVPATGAITVTKSGGTLFAPSATTDATNAANIATGSLAAGRMSANLAAAIDAGISSVAGSFLARGASAWGVPSNFGFDNTNGCPIFTAISTPSPPTAGDLFFDSPGGYLTFAKSGGSHQRLGGKIWAGHGGTANTGTTAVSIFTGVTNDYGSRNIKANTLKAGNEIVFYMTLRVTAAATFTTLALVASLGGTTVLLGVSAAATGTATAVGYLRIFRIKCLTAGVSGTASFTGAGQFVASSLPIAGTQYSQELIPPTPGTLITNIDTTVDLAFDFTAQWGGANQSATLQEASLFIL